MKRSYYVRCGPPDSEWLDDRPTLIMFGRWTHMFNTVAREWFTVTDVPTCPEALNRDGRFMRRINEDQWLRGTGRWGKVEMLEDRIGRRPITRLVKFWRRLLKKKPHPIPLSPPKIGRIEQHRAGDQNGTGEFRLVE